MPFTKIDRVLPLRVKTMFVPGDAMGGHGLIPPEFVCADPSGQNSIVVAVVNVIWAASLRSAPSLFGRVIGLLSGAGNGYVLSEHLPTTPSPAAGTLGVPISSTIRVPTDDGTIEDDGTGAIGRDMQSYALTGAPALPGGQPHRAQWPRRFVRVRARRQPQNSHETGDQQQLDQREPRSPENLDHATHTAIQGPFRRLCQTGTKSLLWS